MNSKQLEGARKLFSMLLWADIALTVVIGLNAFSTVSILKDIQSGARNVDQSLLSSIEFWEGFSKLVFLTMIGVGIGLVKWLNACYGYAKQTIGATGFKNEGWTIAGWIIPIFNLFKPYQVINEIYKAGGNSYVASDDWKKESGSGVLLTWWAFWAVTHFIIWIMTKELLRSTMRNDITIGQAVGLTEMQAWACVFSIVIAGLWFWVSALLTQRLLNRPVILANPPLLQNAYQALSATTVTASPISSSVQTQLITANHQATMSAPINPQVAISQPASGQYDEDAVYEIVANEMESGKTDKGLWTRLFAELDGDEKKIKIAYIKQRAEKIVSTERARIADMERIRMADLEQVRIEEERIRQMALPYRLRYGLVPSDVAAKESGGKATDFLSACLQGTKDVEVMLSNFPMLVAVIDSDGNTGLHLAVLRKHEHLVKSLIEHSACITTRNKSGQTPQDIATIAGMNIPDYSAYKRISNLIASAAKAMEAD